MITIAWEYIDEQWGILKSGSVIPISLSEWDDGDTFTHTSLGVLRGRTIHGALVLGETAVPDYSIVIRLKQAEGSTNTRMYQAPDGVRFEIIGERRNAEKVDFEDVQIERIRTTLESRHAGLIETDLLSKRSVCIVGLGTGGANIAVELAKTGIGSFSLVDAERLEIGNVSRHQAGLSFVGRKKVLAVRDLIAEKNPAAKVDVYPFHAEASRRKELQGVVEGSDIVVCATDSRPSKLFVNELCVASRKPVIFGGAFRRAYGGQVFRVRPHTSACYHCFVLAVPEKESDREIASPEAAAEIAYADLPVPVEPGLAIDIAPISNMVAKLALHELIQNEKSTLHVLDKDLDAPWYLWVNRPEPGTEYASWTPLSECSDQMTILRWYGIYLEKDLGCPTCGDFGQALRDHYGVENSKADEPQIRPFPGMKP